MNKRQRKDFQQRQRRIEFHSNGTYRHGQAYKPAKHDFVIGLVTGIVWMVALSLILFL